MHEGHRERLIGKFLNGDRITDVEFLEIILFCAIPRRDVREQAEELIARFETPTRVFDADRKALLGIKGLGPSAAAMFDIIKRLAEHYNTIREVPAGSFFNYSFCQKYFGELLSKTSSENLLIAFIDGEGTLIKLLAYNDNKRDAIHVNTQDISSYAAQYAPCGAIIAHNHFETSEPSREDDMATRNILYLLEMANVKVYDHLIYCHGSFFSYNYSKRMDKIREQIVNNMYKEIKTEE